MNLRSCFEEEIKTMGVPNIQRDPSKEAEVPGIDLLIVWVWISGLFFLSHSCDFIVSSRRGNIVGTAELYRLFSPGDPGAEQVQLKMKRYQVLGRLSPPAPTAVNAKLSPASAFWPRERSPFTGSK